MKKKMRNLRIFKNKHFKRIYINNISLLDLINGLDRKLKAFQLKIHQ